MLFPIKTVSNVVDFLSVSNRRLEELENTANRLKLENALLRDQAGRDTMNLEWSNLTVLKARITGRDPADVNDYLYIDKGKEDSLFVDQTVVSIDGLVGKVKFINDHYSIIETIEKNGFAVSGLDAKTHIHGILKQHGNLIFDYVRIDDEVNIGDSIYTSGMGDVFPPMILVGTVSEVQLVEDLFFKKVYVKPSVKINRLTSVYLVFTASKSLPALESKPIGK